MTEVWAREYHGTLLFLLLVLPQPLNRPQLRCPSTKLMIHLFWNNLCYTFDHKSTDTKSFYVWNTQKNKEEETSSNSRWAVFCSSFSFATTGVVTAMHLSSKFSHYVVGTKIEGVLTLVLAAFWSATVSVGTSQQTTFF